MKGLRNVICWHCGARYESAADVHHCVACGNPQRDAGPSALRVVSVSVSVNGIPLRREPPDGAFDWR